MFRFVIHTRLFAALCMSVALPASAVASSGDDSGLSRIERLSLAKDFMNKLKPKYDRISVAMRASFTSQDESSVRGYEDGEALLLQPRLGRRLVLDGVITAVVYDEELLISLRDFSEIFDLAIEVDPDAGIAQGWYIKESNTFALNVGKRDVQTNHGSYKVSEQVRAMDGDIWVPGQEIELWFGVGLDVRSRRQEMRVSSEEKFPLQKRLEREKWRGRSSRLSNPVLPDGTDEYQAISVPVVDVATSSYMRKSNDFSSSKNTMVVNTSGDLAHGSLSTYSSWTDDDSLEYLRMKYKRDSVSGDLLGDLNATLFEVGDVQSVDIPLSGSTGNELGMRISNESPTRSFSRPTTDIAGQSNPGWDVELYRGGQLLDMLRVEDDGLYEFKDIVLNNLDNNFRLVFYGPQGEVREQNLYVPVDLDRMVSDSGIYDVSLTLNDTVTYDQNSNSSDDKGAPNLAAFYEKSLMPGLSGNVGIRSGETGGQRDTVLNTGLTTTIMSFLINADYAMDDEGDSSAELSLRRNFGLHKFYSKTSLESGLFDQVNSSVDEDDDTLDAYAFNQTFNLSGPIPFMGSRRDIYDISTSYASNVDGGYYVSYDVGAQLGLPFGTWSNYIKNSYTHLSDSASQSEDFNAHETSWSSSLSTSYGRHRLRFNSDIDLLPDPYFNSLTAAYNYYLSNDLNFGLSSNLNNLNDLTSYSASLNWQAGFIRLSPSITYDSEDNYYARLATRFGLIQDPNTGRVKMYDRALTNRGALSAFVYLDKDGDGAFSEGDEPLPDIVVSAPQNGRRVTTDKNGIAMFAQMARLRATDVYVDKNSLHDPAWISSFEGISIVPREGYVAQIEFPVHMSGEIDGTLYLKEAGSQTSTPLRNIQLSLYNDKGDVEMSTRTDSSGFYYMTQIPPGRYLMMLDYKSTKGKNLIRPEPQLIEIGYDGTVIYGHDIFLQSGEGDVPSEFLASLSDYKRQNAVNFDSDSYDLVLNLGEYNSRLMMSVVWYRLKSRYTSILSGSDLFVQPAQSFANAKTGKHTLRVGLKDADMNDAYSRCRSLIARDLQCEVEIYPSYIKEAKADIPR